MTKPIVDYSPLSGSVAVCHACEWRVHRPTRGTAWSSLARHLKDAHGDYLAARSAADAARHLHESM